MARKPQKALPPPVKTIQEEVQGRPSLYRAEYVDLVTKLCQLGCKDDEIANFIGVTRQTLHNWRAQYPEFDEAIREGRVGSDLRVANRLFNRALGYEWTEQQVVKVKETIYSDTGKKLREVEKVEVVEVLRRAPPDTTAGIFWLKNRRTGDWRDRKELEVGSPSEFKNQSTEELVDYILSESQELGLELSVAPLPPTKVNGNGTQH